MKIYRPKLCECGCGQIVENKFVHGCNVTVSKRSEKMKITNARPEVKEKRSIATKKLWQDPEWVEKVLNARKIAMLRPEVLKRRSEGLKKANNRPEVKEKRIQMQTNKWKDLEYRKMMWNAQNNPKSKEKKSQSQKKYWQDPEFVKRQMISHAIHPNKPETFLMALLNDLYPGEWKFTGDFSFMIGGKNPDFVSINGQKKCIEHYGTYWHEGDDPQDRINLFKNYGWDCLVIWQDELKDFKKLRRKIFDFCEE